MTSSTADAQSTGLWTARPGSRVLLWIGLVLLLVAELVVLTLPFNPAGNIAEQGFWAALLAAGQHGIRPTFITAVVATIFLSWPVLQQEFRRVLDESPNQIISLRWLAAHLMLLSLLIFGTRTQDIRLTSIADWEGWLLLWSLLACGALVTWLFTALPPRFWARWLSQSRFAFLAAAAAALAAYVLGNWMQELWGALQHSTFQMVAMILQLFGQAAVIRPDDMILGTSRFAVIITAHCSGLEGIGLICAFTGLYLWSCRRDLSFPLAFVLLPIGAISIWVLNTIRIAALIFIGGWNQEVALKGFHSAAGWIFFNVIAVGLVWTSSRFQLFAKTSESQVGTNPATGYIVPLIVLFASSLIASMLLIGSKFYTSAVAVPVLCALWYCRATLFSLRWKPSWISILAGGIAFAIVAVMSGSNSAEAFSATSLHQLPMPIAVGLLLLGLAGTVIAIPTAQELALRGYLARKLVAADFENVAFNQFTWVAFLGSSIASGIVTTNWLPGILTGVIFALVMYRRGLLTDAILAHACSSGLLFLLAATTGKWSLLG